MTISTETQLRRVNFPSAQSPHPRLLPTPSEAGSYYADLAVLELMELYRPGFELAEILRPLPSNCWD